MYATMIIMFSRASKINSHEICKLRLVYFSHCVIRLYKTEADYGLSLHFCHSEGRGKYINVKIGKKENGLLQHLK